MGGKLAIERWYADEHDMLKSLLDCHNPEGVMEQWYFQNPKP